MSKRDFRVFLASPGDVGPEREEVKAIVNRIATERQIRDTLDLRLVAWDLPGMEVAMVATDTPQSAIEKGLPNPSECQAAVVILWSRIGTPLPEKYKKPDGSRYLSGTEYEYCDAIAGHEENGQPAVWLYWNRNPPSITLGDPEYAEKEAQLNQVSAFFEDFSNADGSQSGGYDTFNDTTHFTTQFEQRLRDHLTQFIQEVENEEPSTSPKAPPDTALGYTNEALKLDRTEQWISLLKLLNTDRHATLLLYGTTLQSMELFVARLWAYVQSEADKEHDLIEVPAKRDMEFPCSAAEWVNRVRFALDDERSASEALVTRLRNAPVLLIIGRNPFHLSELTDRQLKALKEFLSRSLPEIFSEVEQAPVVRHPLRVLIALSYDDTQAAIEAFDQSMQTAFSDTVVRHRKLKEFQSVDWEHIESYLDGLKPAPSNAVYEKLKQMFAKLDQENMSFRQLTDWLNTTLH
ncbi:hypothetical protein AB833_26730 [Chromatiales bacterium (ex Bugula neritina AB1)]|nr:hypothetical protein AB833_26730 [Chromatiales bacterium (ex Bugula neritina AB1)]